MNIVKRELKSNLKSIIIWSIAIIFILAIWMIEFESFSGNPQINEFLDSMPSGMIDALGMGNMDLSTLEGFISTIALYIYLGLGIHAVLLGSSIIAKEERDKTAEYLFTLPISRKKIVMRKLTSAIIILIIINLITLGTTLITTMKYDRSDSFYKFISLLFISVFILQMIFLSVGMFISSINKRYKKSGNISVIVLMITFLIATLINMVEKLDFIKYITPFKFFDATNILKDLTLEPIFIILSIIIIAVGIAGIFIYYPKRDLYI